MNNSGPVHNSWIVFVLSCKFIDFTLSRLLERQGTALVCSDVVKKVQSSIISVTGHKMGSSLLKSYGVLLLTRDSAASTGKITAVGKFNTRVQMQGFGKQLKFDHRDLETFMRKMAVKHWGQCFVAACVPHCEQLSDHGINWQWNLCIIYHSHWAFCTLEEMFYPPETLMNLAWHSQRRGNIWFFHWLRLWHSSERWGVFLL